MANVGTPLAGYQNVAGTESGMRQWVRNNLPKNWKSYRIIDNGYDDFALNLYIREFYYIGEYEYERWVYFFIMAYAMRRYYTVEIETLDTVYKKRLKIDKRTEVSYAKSSKFYDDDIEQKLGGEEQTLG